MGIETGSRSEARPGASTHRRLLALAGILVTLAGCMKMMTTAGKVFAPVMTQAYEEVQRDNCPEAIRLLERSIAIREVPAYDGVKHAGIAGCKIVLGDLEGARRESQLIIDEYPQQAQMGHLFLSWINYQESDLDAAALSADRGLESARIAGSDDETYQAAHTVMHLALERRELESARELGDCVRGETLAQRMLRRPTFGALEIIYAGNRVSYVRRGGMADLAGILPGDRILAVDGDTIRTFEDLGSAEKELLDRYGETISVNILRTRVPGEDAAPVERRIPLQMRLVYPERDAAQAYLTDLKEARSQVCRATPGPGDTIQPRILIVSPEPGAAVPTRGRVRFTVLASDDTEVQSVAIEGQRATAEVPSKLEQSFLPGKVVRYVAEVPAPAGLRTYRVSAVDAAGNRSEATIDLRPATGRDRRDRLFEHSVALVVGIDRYRSVGPLEDAVADGRAVAGYLREAGFDHVIELYDEQATRARILQMLGDELPGTLGPDDRLVVFFAGHGESIPMPGGGNEGYLVPVESTRQDVRHSGIPMSVIHDMVGRIRARHILLAFDSCFSGLGLKRSTGPVGGGRDPDEFIRKLASQRAVQIITAGGKDERSVEGVRGHGLFTLHLLEGLNGKGDQDRDGYVRGSELGQYVQRVVSDASQHEQTPLWGLIAGDGDFVFEVAG